MRIRSHGLVRNVSSEVQRDLFVRENGLAADALRRPLEPDWETRIPDGLNLDLIPGNVLNVYRLATRGATFTPERLRVAANDERADSPVEYAFEALGIDEIGSNNWVVSGRLTATGRPILANDPHRGQSVPSLRYLASQSPPYATLPTLLPDSTSSVRVSPRFPESRSDITNGLLSA